MMALTLLQQIDAIEFSERSHQLFRDLTAYSPTDEGAAVVLAAAAMLLVRDGAAGGRERLDTLTAEFAELVLATDAEKNPPPVKCVRIVAGTEFIHPKSAGEN